MLNVLIIDRDDYLHDQLHQLRPNWQLMHVESVRDAFLLMKEFPKLPFHLVVGHQQQRATSPDVIMLTRILTLNEGLRHSSFVVLLDSPFNTRDNRAAFAAGARETHKYPQMREELIGLAIKLFYTVFRARKQRSLR